MSQDHPSRSYKVTSICIGGEDLQKMHSALQTSSQSREILTFLSFGPKMFLWKSVCVTAKDAHIWSPEGYERERLQVKKEAQGYYFFQMVVRLFPKK